MTRTNYIETPDRVFSITTTEPLAGESSTVIRQVSGVPLPAAKWDALVDAISDEIERFEEEEGGE